MENQLISSGAYGCVYHPGFNCEGSNIRTKTLVTKVQNNIPEVIDNELKICKIVRSINDYNKYFAPVIKSCKVDIGRFDNDDLKECTILKQKSKYVLMHLKYIKSKPFNKHIENIIKDASVKYLNIQNFKTIIKSYLYCLTGLSKLKNSNIIHFDLHNNNLIYDTKHNHPVFIDFGLSIEKKDLNTLFTDENSIIFAINPSLKQYSIELQIIKEYLNNNISTNRISEVCDEYLTKSRDLKLLNKLYPNFFNDYKQIANKYYINLFKKDKETVIKEITETWKTWDNYALSLIIIRSFNLMIVNDKINKDNNIIINLYKVLIQNISPNPNNRASIATTIDSLKKVIFVDKTNYRTLFI